VSHHGRWPIAHVDSSRGGQRQQHLGEHDRLARRKKAARGQGRGGRPIGDAWAALSGAAGVGFTARPGGLGKNETWLVADRWAKLRKCRFSLSGWIRCEGPARERKGIYIFLKQFLINAEVDRKLEKILSHLRKYETFSGDRVGYLAQLLYGTL
jgi:hypothetical protein